jgi:hypothetical protein
MSKLIGNEFVETIDRIQKGILDSFREYAKAKQANDQDAAERASLQIANLSQESTAALKAEGLKFETELKPNADESEDAKVLRLLTAFARGTRLSRIWDDVKTQRRIGACCAKKVITQVLPALDAINRRGDVVLFLDDTDMSIRARAACWLLDTMPDRCLPMLHEIERTERALNAGWIACWGLHAYERRTGVKSA